MAKELSVSLSYEAGTAEAHDRRDYTPDNAELSLAHRNVSIISCADVAEAVNDFYGPAIKRYNDKQKRDDRKKSEDYYHALLDGSEGYGSGDKQERPVLEYVLQIGNKDDNGVTDSEFDPDVWQGYKRAGEYDKAAAYVQAHLNTSPDRERMKQVLIDEVQRMPGRYPNLQFIMAEYHDDEPGGTGHIHFLVSPYVTDCKRGLDTRVSLSGAMKAMYPGMSGEAALDEWKNDVKDRLTEAMQAEGYDRKFMSNEEQRLSVSNYKKKKQSEALDREITEKQDRMNGLQAAYGDLLQQGENTIAQLQKAAEGPLSASDAEIIAYMKDRFPEDYEYYSGQVQKVKRQKLQQQAAQLQEAQTNATKNEAETAASSEHKQKSAAMPAAVKSSRGDGEPQRSQFTSDLAYYQAKIEWGAKHPKKQNEADDELQK